MAGQSLFVHGDARRVLYFDEEGNGPLPMGGTVGVSAYDFTVADNENPHYPSQRVGLRIEPFGGLYMTSEDAREIAAQLVRAADSAETPTVRT